MALELGPKMQACSERERAFVMHYLAICAEEGKGNATEAARRAGYADAGLQSCSIRVQAHSLLHREKVREAMFEIGKAEFVSLLFPSVMAARKLVENDKHPDHAGMVKTTLSALGFGEKSQVDLNISGSVNVSHTDSALEDLRRMMELGTPREKLAEVFGQSGLDRYERMLASQRLKVIEHSPDE
jgi:phage terminase small subunit